MLKHSKLTTSRHALLLLLFTLLLVIVLTSYYIIGSSVNYGKIESKNEENDRLRQEIALLTKKLSLLSNNKSKTERSNNNGNNNNNIPIWNDEEYLLGYNHWIRGLGNSYLSNKDMKNCLFPSVPYSLTASQGLNNDPFYKEQHECYSWKFSKIHGRTITVNCKTQKHGVYYFQNESLFISDHRMITDSQWIKFNKSDPNQYNKKHNQYILYLDSNTQITWIKCNFHYNYHLSLLPLKLHLPKQYKILKERYDNILYEKPPPNIVLFILDSTSRSNFIRACKESVNYLSMLMENKNSPVKIYQFFRYSTIGWGTSINLGALLGGKVSGSSKNNHNLLSLAQFYENMGYYVPGLYEWKKNEKYRAEWQENWAFSLSKNFGNEYCWIKQRDDIEMYTEFILENINNLSPNKDKLPYFLVLHSIANHAANGAYMFNLDRYFKKLIEYIDFSNTILHIIGDHGCLVGDSTTTIFGRMEVKNPINILIIPKNNTIIKKFNKYLTINQQRMITHYDMHKFYKSLPLLWINQNIDNMYNLKYQNIGKSLPKKNNIKLAKSILNDIIPNNRTCDGIDQGFCFCDTKSSLTIDYNLNGKYYDKLMNLVIMTINDLTGNGKWNCIKYSPKDFKIILHLENESKTNIEIVIEKRHDNIDENEYQLLKKNNRWLTFVAEIRKKKGDNYYIPIIERSKWKIPAITRIDWFKYEKCLITHYNPYDVFPNDKADIMMGNTRRNPLDGLHPIFKDLNLTRFVIKSRSNDSVSWNLRVCTCYSTY